MASTNFCDITSLRVQLMQYAAEIAITVLGEPNWRLCGGRELRFGNRGSLQLQLTDRKPVSGTTTRTAKAAILVQRTRAARPKTALRLATMAERGRLPGLQHGCDAQVLRLALTRKLDGGAAGLTPSSILPILVARPIERRGNALDILEGPHGRTRRRQHEPADHADKEMRNPSAHV
jgi:hypothetical protein